MATICQHSTLLVWFWQTNDAIFISFNHCWYCLLLKLSRDFSLKKFLQNHFDIFLPNLIGIRTKDEGWVTTKLPEFTYYLKYVCVISTSLNIRLKELSHTCFQLFVNTGLDLTKLRPNYNLCFFRQVNNGLSLIRSRRLGSSEYYWSENSLDYIHFSLSTTCVFNILIPPCLLGKYFNSKKLENRKEVLLRVLNKSSS